MRQTVDLASSELVLRDGRRQSLGIGGGGTVGVGAPTVVVPTLTRWLMPGFSCHGLCSVKRAVGGVSGLGCRGGGPGRWSAWLAFRRAPWRQWWLCLLAVWAARAMAAGDSGVLCLWQRRRPDLDLET